MIVKRSSGFYVISEKNNRILGGPYKSRAAAEHRLKQVEYFKHKKSILKYD